MLKESLAVDFIRNKLPRMRTQNENRLTQSKTQTSVPKLTHPLAFKDYRDYWYWFTLLYCSINASKSSNILILSGFIFPAFINFLLAFNQLSKSCSSIRYFDGFRLLVSINVFISLYLANQRSYCFIEQTPSVLSKRYYRNLS